MKYPQTTQENQLSIISGKTNSYNNYELNNMTKSSIPSWELQNVIKAKELIQRWYKPSVGEAIQIQTNLDSAKEAMSRMAKRVYENIIGSERGKELLAKAKKYNISYDKKCINWLELINTIEEYEVLLLQAEEHNIDWDLSEYDPIGLKQEIDYCTQENKKEINDLYRDYFDSRF